MKNAATKLSGALVSFGQTVADRVEAAACWAGWSSLSRAGVRAAEASWKPAKGFRGMVRRIAGHIGQKWPVLEHWELAGRRRLIQSAEAIRETLDRLSWAKGILITVGLIVVLAYVDRMAGRPIAFRLAYLLPIWLSARLGGGVSAFCSMLIVGVFYGFWDAPLELRNAESATLSFAVRWITLGGFLFVIVQLEEALSLAHNRSTRDPLTGLANRTSIEALAEEALSKPADVRLAVIDCDNFKRINDANGHAFGDHALKLLGRKLENAVGEKGTVARIGGDEFVVLFHGATREEAAAVLAEAEKGFRRMLASLDCRSGISYGFAAAEGDGSTYSALYRIADQRMYDSKRSKKKGRACISLPEAIRQAS